jgi:predicted dehydrogenase
MTVPNPLRVAVIGCGRMGRLHARTYAKLPSVRLVGVYDPLGPSMAALAAETGCRAVADAESLLGQVDAVSIAVPTRLHLPAAELFLRKGVACLIEKPLAASVPEAQRIVELAGKHGAIVQTGHIERFNPAVRALAKLRLAPRFIDTLRISPLTFRSLDVGVVMDMMIHDIDIVLSLVRSMVESVESAGTSAIGGVEDICNARLSFANGCVANLNASRLAFRTERSLRLFSPDGYAAIDYHARRGTFIRRDGNLEAIRSAAQRLRDGEVFDPAKLDYAAMVRVEALETDGADPITSQLTAFVEAVQARTAPVVTAEDGLAAVEVAQRIVQSIDTNNGQ